MQALEVGEGSRVPHKGSAGMCSALCSDPKLRTTLLINVASILEKCALSGGGLRAPSPACASARPPPATCGRPAAAIGPGRHQAVIRRSARRRGAPHPTAAAVPPLLAAAPPAAPPQSPLLSRLWVALTQPARRTPARSLPTACAAGAMSRSCRQCTPGWAPRSTPRPRSWATSRSGEHGLVGGCCMVIMCLL